MKKHFLLLVMAFFSLAGWAQTTYDLSEEGWTIKFYDGSGDEISTATYTGAKVAPTIKLEKAGTVLTEGQFNVTWSPSDPINVSSTGYTATITSDMTHTFGDLKNATKKFYVMKANARITTAPTFPSDPLTYTGSAQDLITNTPAAGFTTTMAEGIANPAILYKVNDGEWSTTKPTATDPGTYAVKYKVAGTDNYNGVDESETTVTINGTPISSSTAPVAVTGLAFRWSNTTNAAIPQNLVTAGTVAASEGTMMYSFKKASDPDTKYSEWSTTIPQASDAGNYKVKYKIVGENGHADIPEATLSDEITITAVPPVVTAAKGVASIEYTGVAQALLTTAGTATLGATDAVKYRIRYKAASGDAFPAFAGTPIAYADVKGTAAGFYEVQTLVPTGGNYTEVIASTVVSVSITKPSLFTVAPAAADLTWNNAAQQLITATVKEDAIAKYTVSTTPLTSFSGVTWNDIAAITGTDAGSYYVYYKVENENYLTVEPTLIPNVQIKKKVLSVKVNDVTKEYDGTTTVPTPTGGKFTFVTRIEGDGLDANFGALTLVSQSNKNAGTYTGALTVSKSDLEAVSTNYEYAIIPGNLTINQRKVNVTAQTGLTTTYGTTLDISDKYVVSLAEGSWPTGESAANVFATAPVLTSDAPANPGVGTYNLSFTEGTLKTPENYAVTYSIPAGANFTVTADLSRKLVITVLPHTQEYTGVAEDWTKMEAGKDYAVTGLVDGDAIVTAPTFTRSDATNFNIGTYDLTATIDENTIVADKTKYPGGIFVNNSTFQIVPRVLTATVSQQTLLKDATSLPDPTAWSVEGMQNGEDVSTLNGVLQLVGSTAALGSVDNGIKLVIDNDNYALKTGTEFGKLLVISADQFVLDPADVNLNDKIQAAGIGEYSIQFGSWSLNAKEWYAVVLPFKTTPAELVGKLGTYVIANRLKSSSIKEDGEVVVNFGVEMDEIPAGEPFLIKAAADKNLNVTATTPFTGKVIAKTISNVVTDKATFTGTYETGDIVQWGYGLDGTTADADAKYRWLAHKDYKGDNNWKNPKSNPHTLAPMEAYLILDPAAAKARIYVEDIDENGTTSIKSLSVDDVNGLNVKGWYTVGGMKMQNAPTQKGVYIKDGKKVIIK